MLLFCLLVIILNLMLTNVFLKKIVSIDLLKY